ncbi:MBOAT family O-acyltransferase [Granulicella aggregans]|uniref:MBOAT family O-acyltransferase n=1 Tax=Granulicella aggregans TaxID=474949 RepID=UPI0021E06968|nr:MBOAT family O-acyltransferase [Granulicella aggregans]
MLFNSYQFIFLFLPVALAGYEAASRVHYRAVVLWLGFISLVFYGWWQPSLLILLVGSITLNYLAAALISRRIPNRIRPGTWLFAAIVLNLLVLGYYKYFIPTANFFSTSFGLSKHWADVVLPLGISFFTFTQIAFLVDLTKGSAEQESFPDYLLFVTFFPHLIAGPILHHREMMPQFKLKRLGLNLSDVTIGGTWFVLGLAKKVLIADTFAGTVFAVFHSRDRLPASVAWVGALAYTIQLYFDFSGYSDMALGLARMFSIDFPLNFNSPAKSASIIEVWQRWHMTLGRYIFTYIYNPVTRWVSERRRRQGKGISRRERAMPRAFLAVVAMPLMLTMFLAGIWHGAGLQFMVFGLLHGIYLCINNAWRQFYRRPASAREESSGFGARIKKAATIGSVFCCMVISLVFFRADSVAHAASILAAMFGLWAKSGPGAADWMSIINMHRALPEVLLGLAIMWGLPNTQQILTKFKPSLQKTAWNQEGVSRLLLWSPSTGWALAVGLLFFMVLVELQQPSTFLYFQF